MAFRFRDLSVKDYTRLIGAFLVPLCLGIAGRLWYPVSLWPHEVAQALADALIIAGIIGILIDLFAAKFIIEKVADELSEKLVGRGLPAELQSQIRSIVKTDFVRERYVKSYSFSASEQPDRICLTSTFSFEVRNYSDSVREYSPIVQEEGFYNPVFYSVDYAIPGGKRYSYNAEQLLSKIKFDEETKAREISDFKKLRLDPFKENPKAVCHVAIKMGVTYPYEYVDVNSFMGPTLGVTIRLDSIPDDLDFQALGDYLSHEEGSCIWYFPGPFMRGQNLRPRWFKKSQSKDAK